jgi:cobalt-zinc-cadmium efflux system membrane fusion protein
MYAELRFTARGETLTVPVAAVLIKDGKQRVVYVQRPDGRFEVREVRTGPTTGGMVPILEGLTPGERIVVKGALLLDRQAEQLL